MQVAKSQLQQAVLDAAIACCDNAAYLPDGIAQVPTPLVDALGDALSALADFEEAEYAAFLGPEQVGLNPAQVALQRLLMPPEQVKIEQAIDAADRLLGAFFDEVIVPGYSYLSKPNCGEVRYIHRDAIASLSKTAERTMQDLDAITIQTVEGEIIKIGKVITDDLAIVQNGDLFSVTHRHSGHLIALFGKFQDAQAIATCIKFLDWSWQQPAQMPETTQRGAIEIFSVLKDYIEFKSQR